MSEENPSQAKAPTIVQRVLDHFEDHPKQRVTLSDLTAALNLSQRQVRTAIAQARHTHKKSPTHRINSLQVVVRGSAWRYDPDRKAKSSPPKSGVPETAAKASPPAPAAGVGKMLFEEVGPVPRTSGVYVIADESGVLYRAAPIR